MIFRKGEFFEGEFFDLEWARVACRMHVLWITQVDIITAVVWTFPPYKSRQMYHLVKGIYSNLTRKEGMFSNYLEGSS